MMLSVIVSASVLVATYPTNPETRYEAGVHETSTYSAVGAFSHRPVVFRLLAAFQRWVPEHISTLFGPHGSLPHAVAFETAMNLIALLAAAGAATLLWLGLRARKEPLAWVYAAAVYSSLGFVAPALNEPDWWAVLLAVAAVGAALLWNPRLGAAIAGVFLALATLVKGTSVLIALIALVVIWNFDRRRGWYTAATATIVGLVTLGLIGWLVPYEFRWLIDIHALQPTLARPTTADLAGFFMSSAIIRWPVVALIPAFFVGAKPKQRWLGAAMVTLALSSVAVQGQFYFYHSIPLVTVGAVLAVGTLTHSQGRLIWPLLAVSAISLIIFATPTTPAQPPQFWYPLAMVLPLGLMATQWWLLKQPRRTASTARAATAASVVVVSFLVSQTPFSPEALSLRGGSSPAPVTALANLRNSLEYAAAIRARIGDETEVSYLTWGDVPYYLGNPTACRYPSALFLQRQHARQKISKASWRENLNCLSRPSSQWLIWQDQWVNPDTADKRVLAVIDRDWDCTQSFEAGPLRICPRRPGR
jgi:hypothetical protein